MDNSVQIRLHHEGDSQRLADALAQLRLTGSVWLSGDLGAGKTTLTRYWLEALGHTGAVKSPTFTLVEPYQLLLPADDGQQRRQPVYHADLYRLQDPEELSFIGFDEYLQDPQALLIIEWASRAAGYLPEPKLCIDIYRVPEHEDRNDDYSASTTHHELRQVDIYYGGLQADQQAQLQHLLAESHLSVVG